MKYLMLGFLLLSCSKKDNVVVHKQTHPLIDEQPIALVLVDDTIYHCSSIKETQCGLTANCGNYELICIKNPTVEYL